MTAINSFIIILPTLKCDLNYHRPIGLTITCNEKQQAIDYSSKHIKILLQFGSGSPNPR